jgi:hypothetical protein
MDRPFKLHQATSPRTRINETGINSLPILKDLRALV